MDERSRMMGRSRRRKSRSESREIKEDKDDGVPSPSELYLAANEATGYRVTDLEEPLLGPDDMDNDGGERSGKVPIRLQVYNGRFGHWEREGLRKYKGAPGYWWDMLIVRFGFSSIMADQSNRRACRIVVCLGVHRREFSISNSAEDQPPPDGSKRSAPSIVPLLPLLIVLLIPALVIPPAFLLLLRKTVRPVLLATAITIPFSLFICGWWAFAASFETSGLDGVERDERWWGTTGLRLCAGGLWCLAATFGRMVWTRRKRLERTAAVVEVSIIQCIKAGADLYSCRPISFSNIPPFFCSLLCSSPFSPSHQYLSLPCLSASGLSATGGIRGRTLGYFTSAPTRVCSFSWSVSSGSGRGGCYAGLGVWR